MCRLLVDGYCGVKKSCLICRVTSFLPPDADFKESLGGTTFSQLRPRMMRVWTMRTSGCKRGVALAARIYCVDVEVDN